MSRAERELAQLRAELYRIAKTRDEDREAMRRAVTEHPACPRCAVLAAQLELARETIDAMAAEIPPALTIPRWTIAPRPP